MLQRLQTGSLQLLEFDDDQIPQHQETRYVNATKLCQLRNKTYSNWRRLDSSQSIIDRVAKMTGLSESELIVSITNGPVARRATWMDHRLAASLATWVDPIFAIHCAAMAAARADVSPTPSAAGISILWKQVRDEANSIEQDLRRLNGGHLEERDKIKLMACHRDALLRLSDNGSSEPGAAPGEELLISTICRKMGYQDDETFKQEVGRVASRLYAERHGHPPTKRQMALSKGICVPVNYYTTDDEEILTNAVTKAAERLHQRARKQRRVCADQTRNWEVSACKEYQ